MCVFSLFADHWTRAGQDWHVAHRPLLEDHANNLQNTFTYDNGKNFTFPVAGTLKSTQYSEGWFDTEYEDWDTAIAAIEAGEPVLNEQGEVISGDDAMGVLTAMKGST
jgi:hypothetical protein